MRKIFVFLLVVLGVAAILLAPSYLRYRRTAGAIPPGVTLGGVDVEGLDEEAAIEAVTRRFEEPVALYFGDERIILRPQTVGFRVSVEPMLVDAQRYRTISQLLRFLVGQAIERPMVPIEIPLRYSIDEAALDSWLAEVATSHDRAPSKPQPIVATMTIAAGLPGERLNISASRDRVLLALRRPTERSAVLVVEETEPIPISIESLQELLTERLEDFPGIAGLFLHHIPTGDEVAINADVAFAGMSTMKIIILSEVYRKLDAPPDVETTRLITETVAVSGNYTANLLLAFIDDGSASNGVQLLNDSIHRLGLKNTFMAAPYDQRQAVTPHVVTEANSRTDLNTQPDPYVQTTPRDIGTILQMLVECSEGGGTLLAAYPDDYTLAECQQALDFLSLNEVTALLSSGVPEGNRVVHKHGYVSDTHGDVAAIWGPDGPYVLSLYLYDPPWLEWSLSTTTMDEISRAVWNFFDTVRQEPGPEGEG